MVVRYWSEAIPGDRNHVYEFAEALGIEFFKFPYSAYMGRVGNTSVQVSKHYDYKLKTEKWYVNLLDCLSDGRTKLIEQFITESKDEAFEWAAKKMTEREEGK